MFINWKLLRGAIHYIPTTCSRSFKRKKM